MVWLICVRVDFCWGFPFLLLSSYLSLLESLWFSWRKLRVILLFSVPNFDTAFWLSAVKLSYRHLQSALLLFKKPVPNFPKCAYSTRKYCYFLNSFKVVIKIINNLRVNIIQSNHFDFLADLHKLVHRDLRITIIFSDKYIAITNKVCIVLKLT